MTRTQRITVVISTAIIAAGFAPAMTASANTHYAGATKVYAKTWLEGAQTCNTARGGWVNGPLQRDPFGRTFVECVR